MALAWLVYAQSLQLCNQVLETYLAMINVEAILAILGESLQIFMTF